MRITTWNVNGLRKLKSLQQYFEKLDSDIICIQETKLSGENDVQLESLAFVPGYHSFFSMCKMRPGYSGVATFCRKRTATPVKAGESLSDDTGGAMVASESVCTQGEGCACEGEGYSATTLQTIFEEGRCVITDHTRFVLINVYVPAVTVEHRASFKMSFLHALRAKMDVLRAVGRHVVIVGDFNICPSRIDSAERMRIATLYDSEWEQRPSRKWLSRLLRTNDGDFVDAFRELHPSRTHAYTCWSEATQARRTNYGVRIDLTVMDRDLFHSDVQTADIWPHIMGSDHCPATVNLSHSVYEKPTLYEPPPFCTRFKTRFIKRQMLIDRFFKRLPSQESTSSALSLASQCLRTHLTPQELAPLSPDKSIKKKSRQRHGTTVSEDKAKQKKQLIFKPMTTTSSIAPEKHFSPVPLNRVTGQQIEQPKFVRASDAAILLTSGSQQSSKEKAGDMSERKLKSSKAWGGLLSTLAPAPLCRHGQRSILKSVSKSGENKGRTFFSCAYPQGIGNNTKCNFFKWAS